MSCEEDGEMPAAVAEVLENDDLLCEILLRLAPDPSSLPRASLVCHRGAASSPTPTTLPYTAAPASSAVSAAAISIATTLSPSSASSSSA